MVVSICNFSLELLMAAALATARRDDTDAEQQEGCVQLRELQLYRRPGGEPWLLGRGSNGMVSMSPATWFVCASASRASACL